MKKAMILGIASGLGSLLANHLSGKGWSVYGSARNPEFAAEKLDKIPFEKIIKLDFTEPQTFDEFENNIRSLKVKFDCLVVAPGTMLPIGNFAEIEESEWLQGIQVNFTSPVLAARRLFKFMNQGDFAPLVLFFSGGGNHNAPVNFSSYISSKIALIKMVELLDAEIENLKFCVVGPGWMDSDIHQETLLNCEKAPDAYLETKRRYAENDFVAPDKLLAFFDWALSTEKEIIGGRNFSSAHDQLDNHALCQALSECKDLFKLRRFGNNL